MPVYYGEISAGKSANPVLPSFNETFEISSDYGYGNEYASYTVEVSILEPKPQVFKNTIQQL